jgi:hypothetical protein
MSNWGHSKVASASTEISYFTVALLLDTCLFTSNSFFSRDWIQSESEIRLDETDYHRPLTLDLDGNQTRRSQNWSSQKESIDDELKTRCDLADITVERSRSDHKIQSS